MKGDGILFSSILDILKNAGPVLSLMTSICNGDNDVVKDKPRNQVLAPLIRAADSGVRLATPVVEGLANVEKTLGGEEEKKQEQPTQDRSEPINLHAQTKQPDFINSDKKLRPFETDQTKLTAFDIARIKHYAWELKR